MTSEHIVSNEDNYYVYALTQAPAGETFDPHSVFYVGKGTGTRWASHFRDAKREISRFEDINTDVEDGPMLSAKHAAIREILESSDDEIDLEQYAYIVKGGIGEKDAFALEALTIELLDSMGVGLTNLVRGHQSANLLKPAAEVRRYYGAETFDVESISVDEIYEFCPGGERSGDTLVIAVKGTGEDMSFSEDLVPVDQPHFVDGVFRTLTSDDDTERVRRGWDPREPWNDEEARERARHYWPINSDAVSALQEVASDGRLEHVLLINDPRAGQTVVRYHWQVEKDGRWLEYGHYEGDEWSRFKVGIPLGDAFDEATDPILGTVPTDAESGRHVLTYRAGGVGFFSY